MISDERQRFELRINPMNDQFEIIDWVESEELDSICIYNDLGVYYFSSAKALCSLLNRLYEDNVSYKQRIEGLYGESVEYKKKVKYFLQLRYDASTEDYKQAVKGGMPSSILYDEITLLEELAKELDIELNEEEP